MSGAQIAGRPGERPVDGVILYDKPAQMSSHDVVARVRRELPRGTKVGHAGTLDPFATGLLLVLIGRATRVQRFLMALPKRYEAVARFGARSSTGDPEGEIIQTGVVPVGAVRLPTGTIAQVPPAYSAVKVGGRRAYALARAGIDVELAPREVEVYAFDELWARGEQRAYAIECSSGTYVRTLISELGDAYCQQLRRTRIGHFDVADADPTHVMPLDDALAFLPAIALTGDDARRAAHGVAVSAPRHQNSHGSCDVQSQQNSQASRVDGEGDEPAGARRLVDADGLIALAEPTPDGLWKPIVGFRG